MICPKCQTENPEGAKFCRKCGERLIEKELPEITPEQPITPSVKPKTGTNLPENIAGALCYVLGFITGIIFLLLEKENRFVRFHAMQSIITFGGLFVLSFVLGFFPFFGWMIRLTLTPLVNLLGFILWIVLMVKAYQGEMYKLPYIGDLAEKQI